jgi:hypothetical protein
MEVVGHYANLKEVGMLHRIPTSWSQTSSCPMAPEDR